ncbi:MAG: helix-turn-helix transcriptional regulator [Streptomyces sp.]|nr:helix-turn-helix transcriptional regulator [Streptomyces sp.]
MLARGYEELTSAPNAERVRICGAPESGRRRASEIADDDFGASLMRRRLSSGWSLATLAKKTNYSRGYLNNLELGRKSPSTAVAEACDQALHAGGDLIRRARRVLSESALPLPMK